MSQFLLWGHVRRILLFGGRARGWIVENAEEVRLGTGLYHAAPCLRRGWPSFKLPLCLDSVRKLWLFQRSLAIWLYGGTRVFDGEQHVWCAANNGLERPVRAPGHVAPQLLCNPARCQDDRSGKGVEEPAM